MLLLIQSALAATLNVGPGQAYTDLGVALASAASGDEVYVHEGTYELSGTHTTSVDDLTVRGEGREVVSILPAPGGADCLLHLDGVVASGKARLAGFSTECDLWATGHAHVEVSDVSVVDHTLYVEATSVVVSKTSVGGPNFALLDVQRAQDVTLSKVDVVGGMGAVVDLAAPARVHVEQSRFVDSTQSGLWVDDDGDTRITLVDNWVCGNANGGVLVYARDGLSLSARGNRFVGNSNYGYGAGLAVTDWGADPTHVDLVGNVFWGNAAGSGMSVSLPDVNELVLVNNVFAASGQAAIGPSYEVDLGGTPTVVDHNLWWDTAGTPVGGPTGVVATGPSAVFADPMFIAPSTDCDVADFGLLPGSPAIDAGHPSMLDPDGTVRDIGR